MKIVKILSIKYESSYNPFLVSGEAFEKKMFWITKQARIFLLELSGNA